ncbi:protein kinase [Pseudomonas sp. 10-1B]|uniref:trifunctional serine/threonine-protein kinase/ATP-binding protein/sensor histidine kinase n=1 Tax=Pseudomonas sp. 10-1B TaxID=1546029 RepID=UPI00061EC6F7|nr:trifunctional serine/threonine-protein kinase/ATP-binding protein/sensor histidine kinase [Pseudomonas sp. 10-1B]KIY38814.1 protein kinase [Pseudomonas sp. 10-1B]
MAGKQQILWNDGDRLFCRLRRPDGSNVLVMRPVNEQPLPATVDRLTHEYLLREQLDASWALLPQALERINGKPRLVLGDPGGQPLSALLVSPLDIETCLRLAVEISVALGRLHLAGLVHKDLKPQHILVNCDDGKARLTGFGLASRFPRERQPPEPPETIAGTLAYMAPEQTGRMNRSVDSRSDLYALGVSLYQMLTGSLPFNAADPMEWVHCHIARKPLPPCERVATVPQILSQVVMKLLAKTAEDRYQSAAGLEHDLRRCLADWRQNRRIMAFSLDEQGTPERLLIPEKLYGREREVQILEDAFTRMVRSGVPELVLVSGYSGIGKSSVVNELHKVLVPPRGLFASGKFDQYKRDIPYSTLVQAFQGLVRTLLGKSSEVLAEWRNALLAACGPNARLMTDLIPELRLIVGEPAAVPELDPQQAQRRFLLVLRRFIAVFASAEHPLALFLDDLQWLDAATLDLLEDLLTHADLRHVMVVGAYRDNEVDARHPLNARLQAIRKAGAPVHEIRLSPLARPHIEQLIAESLHCPAPSVMGLAQLVQDKTAGNPFFVIQFLQALAEESLLAYDHAARRWRWDSQRIHAKGYTDNVVDLMVGKLARLPLATRQALQHLACLGNVAQTQTLGLVLDLPVERVQAVLWAAVRLELVAQQEDTCTFVHDRIHEAAYSMIAEAERAPMHLRIGRLLAEQIPAHHREESIFEIVGQLNRGAALIDANAEREQLAELNLLAGRRAKAASAYSSALAYLSMGEQLLNEGGAAHPHELSFALALNLAECEFLTGQLEQADNRLVGLAQRARTAAEGVAVACLHMDVCLMLDRSDRAVAVCLAWLRQVGIEWVAQPDDDEVRSEYDQIALLLGERSIEQLIDLPLMEDATSLATLDALCKLFAPAVQTNANLACLTICKAVSLSLAHGNCDASCMLYANIGRVSRRFGDYLTGYRFGRLGCELVERRGLQRFEAGTFLCFSMFVVRWTRPVSECRELLRRAFVAANRVGDLPYAAYVGNGLISDQLFSGEALGSMQAEAEQGLAYAEKVHFGLVIDFINTQLALIRTLRGQTPTFGCLDDDHFSEARFEQHLRDAPDLALAAGKYWVRKLQARYLAGDYAAAEACAAQAKLLTWVIASFFEEAEYHFFAALTLAAREGFDQATLQALAEHHGQLQIWAQQCAATFASRLALVEAEIARVEGRLVEAEHLYEQAIQLARDSGFVHVEALASELAARFYGARGLARIARVYLRDARYGYLRWGAEGKVRQLDSRHRYLRNVDPEPGPTATIATPVEHLDLATVLKVSQAVSGEVDLQKLINQVLRTAIEQAGAERGVLVRARGGEARVVAQASVGEGEVALCNEPVSSTLLAESVLYQVLRTGESLCLDDAISDPACMADNYIRRWRARSLLCLPLTNQARVVGALYLENNLSSRVFDPARIAVLRLVASQAAISLENARLYHEVAEREARNRQVQSELAHANRVATMGQLAASIAHEVNQPIAATVTNANAAIRWLRAQPPQLDEVGLGLGRIIKDANRAAEVLGRIRELIRKAPPQKQAVDVNAVVLEMVDFTRGEALKWRALVHTALAEGLPQVQADRVELQQVLLNLIINALEAMSDVDEGCRELQISTAMNQQGVQVTVSDSGPGFATENLELAFAPFYTTKASGLGMGLSICRSIVEAQGGQLTAARNHPRGATVQFTLAKMR